MRASTWEMGDEAPRCRDWLRIANRAQVRLYLSPFAVSETADGKAGRLSYGVLRRADCDGSPD
jgi:hypothetical protein